MKNKKTEDMKVVELKGETYYLDMGSKKLISTTDKNDIIELTNEEAEKYQKDEFGMDEYRTLACCVIDDVSDKIEEIYGITPKINSDGDEIDEPALINGEFYYSLEDDITEKIKEIVMKRGNKFIHREL